MIDSYRWRQELLLELNYFKRIVRSRKKFSDSLVSKSEKFFLVSAFMIRKLIDDKKLTDKVEHSPISVVFFSKLFSPSVFDRWATFHPEKIYDLTTTSKISITLNQICDMAIHSGVLLTTYKANNGKFQISIVITSEREQDKLYLIPLALWEDIVRKVIGGGVSEATFTRRPSDGALVVTRKN